MNIRWAEQFIGNGSPHTLYMPPYTRRDALTTAGVVAVSSAIAIAAEPSPAEAASTTGFFHGVASGDPLPTSILLWTRLTPWTSATPGSGVGPAATVGWEIALNTSFTSGVKRGSVATSAARDHTVKVIPAGLRSATTYYFRFSWGGKYSPVGRTRTAPASTAAVAKLRMGVVSCANYQAGYFSAYRHLANRGDLDVVLHLGDYLSEYGVGEYQARDKVVRPHDPTTEMTTLNHHRRRHAQYKKDVDLQKLHAAVPFIITWDDHEFANDAWSGGAENHTEGAEGVWTQRRAWSKQAYSEWMPVRFEPGGDIYRRFGFGKLASISMLDLRTYRSQQVASPADPAISSPTRTITGTAQMSWLLGGLSSTATQWKLVGNPVMITPVRFPSTLNAAQLAQVAELTGTATIDGIPYNVDQWDGYTADRSKVTSHLRNNAITDAVFLTGDIHSGWACDIPADPLTYPANGASVAAELVCTSVTSDNLDDITMSPPRTTSLAVEEAFKAANPHIKYLDFDSHGFSVLEVTPESVRMDWYVLADRTSPTSTANLSTSWQVAAGTRKVSKLI